MLRLSFMVGLVGAILSLMGSTVAIFTVEITQYGSEYVAEDNLQERGRIGVAISVVAILAAFRVRSSPKFSATLMILASFFGLFLLLSYFLVGAILMLIAAYYAIRGHYFRSRN
ncbi:MAG: hypothetical protein CL776_06520 [Chloroflexi bacterium]|nr:hypothetical protein [Chloroflexota bacterium]